MNIGTMHVKIAIYMQMNKDYNRSKIVHVYKGDKAEVLSNTGLLFCIHSSYLHVCLVYTCIGVECD